MAYERWTPTAAQSNNCSPHTWIRSWARDVESLRAAVLAYDWQWHLALDTTTHHQLVIDLHQLAATRYADYRDASTNVRKRYLGTVEHVILAVGPGFDCTNRHLRWIARLGRTTGIHLAVDSRHRDDPLVADEFIDNINGLWTPIPSETSYPTGYVSTGALQIRTDTTRAHAATIHARATELDTMIAGAARSAQHLVETEPLSPDDPRIQAVISAAENHRWRVAPYNAGRCDFVHDASDTAVVVRWGTQQRPVSYAATGPVDTECGADRRTLVSADSPTDDPIAALLRFFTQAPQPGNSTH